MESTKMKPASQWIEEYTRDKHTGNERLRQSRLEEFITAIQRDAMEAAHDSAAKRMREVLLYCKLWTEGDVETLHLRPERKVLEHRIRVISEAIQLFDALPQNAKNQAREPSVPNTTTAT